MRHRHRKIQLLETVHPSPNKHQHTFMEHDQHTPLMRICHEDTNGCSQLAEIFYEAVVTEPLLHPQHIQLHPELTPLQNITNMHSSSKFSQQKMQKDPPGPSARRKLEKQLENSLRNILQKQSTGLHSWRSQSLGQDRTTLSIKINHCPSRCLSTRPSRQASNENISPVPKRATSGSKIKQIKYSVIHPKKII